MKPLVQSFGCRLNIWESEVISRHSEAANLNDTIIINTCAVTAEAEKQARQSVRRHRRDNPDARIVVTGCAAQIDPSSWISMAEVDAIIGNHDKLQADVWQNLSRRNSPEQFVKVSDIMRIREVAPHLLEGFDAHTRAFLQIQQGCDHRCTFCIIPHGRGNSRSVPVDVVIEQIQKLAAAEIGEVVLTGVDISSWGSDFDNPASLGRLVKDILVQTPDLKRLRLSSIDPAEIDDDLLDVLASDPRLMPHLHLSVQHGDDIILKRMKRRHQARDVINLTKEIRRLRPDVVFGADMIAGFPTENEDAHQASLDLVDAASLVWLHVFPYSPRAGTPASRMPQVNQDIIKARAAELRARALIRKTDFLKSRIGHDDEILLETGGIGHSRQFARVKLVDKAAALVAGSIYRVRVTGLEGDVLTAETRP